MRRWLGGALLLACIAMPAAAQETPRIEVSGAYTFVRSNAPPGGCSCFSMNGASGAASFNLLEDLGAVADFTVVHNGNVDSSGQALTLTSFLFGPRFSWRSRRRLTPFGEIFLGGSHASGLGYSGSAGPGSAFAMAMGGGLDLNAGRHMAVRLVEADYYFTHFQNGVNSRENNLRLSFGIVFRIGHLENQ